MWYIVFEIAKHCHAVAGVLVVSLMSIVRLMPVVRPMFTALLIRRAWSIGLGHACVRVMTWGRTQGETPVSKPVTSKMRNPNASSVAADLRRREAPISVSSCGCTLLKL